MALNQIVLLSIKNITGSKSPILGLCSFMVPSPGHSVYEALWIFELHSFGFFGLRGSARHSHMLPYLKNFHVFPVKFRVPVHYKMAASILPLTA